MNTTTCSCNIGSTTRSLAHWASCPLFGDPEAPATPNREAQARALGQNMRRLPEDTRADAYRREASKAAAAILTRLDNGRFIGSGRAPEEFEVLLALARILDTMDGTAE